VYLLTDRVPESIDIGPTIGICWGSLLSERLSDTSNSVVATMIDNGASTTIIKKYVWKWKRVTNCGNNLDALLININTPCSIYYDLNNDKVIECDSSGVPDPEYAGVTYNVYTKNSNGIYINNTLYNTSNIGILLKPGQSCLLGMRFLTTKGDTTDISNNLCTSAGYPIDSSAYSVDIVSSIPYDYTYAPSWNGEIPLLSKQYPVYDDPDSQYDVTKYDTPYYEAGAVSPSSTITLCPF
jgi:hypothetical protein